VTDRLLGFLAVTLLRHRTRSSCFSRPPYRATISVWVNTSILSDARCGPEGRKPSD
jgi:hypothetical protein